jgi:competence protein ComEC
MATVGIIYFHDKISILFKEIKNFYIRAILSALSISISAQIFLIPLCAYYFGKISLIAAISNLIIVPILSLIPPFAFTFYILTFISQNLSQIITYPLSWLIKMILFITDFLGGLKYVSINMPKPNIVQIFLFLIGIFYTVEFFRDKKRFVFALLIIVIGFSYSFALNVYKKHKDLEFIYENSNMSVLQIRRNGKNTFIISQKTNRYYDKLYIFSFKQFLSFSNIKSPSIYAFGFNDIQKLNADLGTQVNDGKDL